MKWNHIMDKQPEHGERIIQIDPPYSDVYSMGIRDYYQTCDFQQILEFYEVNNLGKPDFYWMSAKDFPFPNQPERSKREDFGFYGKPIIDQLFDDNGNII